MKRTNLTKKIDFFVAKKSRQVRCGSLKTPIVAPGAHLVVVRERSTSVHFHTTSTRGLWKIESALGSLLCLCAEGSASILYEKLQIHHIRSSTLPHSFKVLRSASMLWWASLGSQGALRQSFCGFFFRIWLPIQGSCRFNAPSFLWKADSLLKHLPACPP